MRAYCLQCLEPSGFERFPDKQANTVTLFSPEYISSRAILYMENVVGLLPYKKFRFTHGKIDAFHK